MTVRRNRRDSALMCGVGLTIPVARLKPIVETLLTKGRANRGYLGVGATVQVRIVHAGQAQEIKVKIGELK